jgi:diguanylate cyclase (GGDEF)-like protein
LVNREGRESYSDGDHTLIDIFAAYISSSIQNTIDGIRAKELAQRDDLTGLYNDRYLHYRLRTEIKAADAAGGDVSLLFLDLDCFKEINDRFGHLEGSRTLHMMGVLLEGEIPPGAVPARYGGDEFLVILPAAGIEEATAIARRLRDKIAATAFSLERPGPGRESQLHVTGSLGVASLRAHVAGEQAELSARANALIRVADEAMYLAKEGGRNRVAVVHPKE